MSQPSLEIRLKRINKIYYEGDPVSGLVVIESKQELTHNGLLLTLIGNVVMELSSKTHGLFEAVYQSTKPIILLNTVLELAKPGKFPPGKTEIPFEFPLKSKNNKRLYETYRGVYINIQYYLQAELKRSLLYKALTSRCDFLVYYKTPVNPETDVASTRRVDFVLSPSTVHNVKDKASLPRFELRGYFDSTICCLNKPLTGSFRLEHSEREIKSIEIQLVRVEVCGCAEGYSKDSTEIENLQMAEGDVARGVDIPIYLQFPRLFTCPSVVATNFKIDFEMNIVLVFADEHLVTETLPLKLTRF